MRSAGFNADRAEVTLLLRLEWKQNCHFGDSERRPAEPAPVTHLLRPTPVPMGSRMEAAAKFWCRTAVWCRPEAVPQ